MTTNTEQAPRQRQGLSDFYQILDEVKRNPLQKKRIEQFLASQDDRYWAFAERFARMLRARLLATTPELREGVNAYQRMCNDFIKEQIYFRRTGHYRHSCEAHTRNIYKSDETMTYYMKGLLISFLFWKQHYLLLRFFELRLKSLKPRRFLEVGVGHGLFSALTLQAFPELAAFLVDISSTSLNMARLTLVDFGVATERVQFLNEDFLTLNNPDGEVDFLIMAELIEHVDHPELYLAKAGSLLRDDGRIYMTTCANAPAIDHVYHFRNVQQIRRLVGDCGFEIEAEVIIPASDVPEAIWEPELIPISYGAYLKKRGSGGPA